MRKLILVLLLAAAAYGAWFHETQWPVRGAGDPPQPLLVAQGAGVLDIGRQLQQLGLVRHPEVFRVYVLSRGATGRLRAGEYALEGSMSVEQIVDKLVRGDVVRHTVTFPEGTNLEDMARLAAAKGIPMAEFLAAARNPEPIKDLDPDAKDLEGYLFPDTYDIPRGPEPAAQLVARMVRRFRTVMAPELTRLPSGRTLRQVVTLASIVEHEAAVDAERPLIAGVYQNRLNGLHGVARILNADPTVSYAADTMALAALPFDQWKDYFFWKVPPSPLAGVQVDADLQGYQTYQTGGLIPGPISTPSLASIDAALSPNTRAGYLYFVLIPDTREHAFAKTLREHNANLRKYHYI